MRSLVFFLLLLPCLLAAQVPQAFDFQGVARDASGNPVVSQPIGLQLSILVGSPAGSAVYVENQSATTSPFGLFNVQIGNGTVISGSFPAIDWASDAHYLKVEYDPAGGSNYIHMGTTQLLSVPYALVSGSSTNCFSVSLSGDTLHQGNGCFVIIPGISSANGGCADVDGDGYFDQAGCGTPIDCNDGDPAVNPGLVEICGNGIDDDCSGSADDNSDPQAHLTWYPDQDGDGFGNDTSPITSCTQPAGHVLEGGDCDDSDPQIYPGQGCSDFCDAPEQQYIDANQDYYLEQYSIAYSNCFGSGDQEQCIQDALDLLGIPIGLECNTCAFERMECGMQSCLGECLSGISEDCEECIRQNCNAAFLACVGLTDADGDGWASGSDCNDNDPGQHPSAAETCDGNDNDCDGQIDQNIDLQNDDQNCGGCGIVCPPGTACQGGICEACVDNDQDGFTTCDGDCDDSDLQINPGAEDICDGIDNNCDGTVDEGVDLQTDPQNCGACGFQCPVGASCVNGSCVTCTDADQDGFTTCDGDCDDTNAQIGPGANEQCNGIDDDCDGFVDEGNVCSSSCSDGIQNGQETGVDCGGPACPPCTQCLDQDGDGYTTCDGDCDDTNSSTHPGANEICGDGIDNDCDGVVDYDFNSDPNNCGGCELVCPPAPNTSVACASGVCMFICNAGYADCDGNMNNGCETSISNDQNNCGACGVQCPSGMFCYNGQCLSQCPPAGQACDDGDACTVNDVEDGTCNCAGTPLNCDDGNPCTEDQCVNGNCMFTPVPDGEECSTGICQAGYCMNCSTADADLDGYTECYGDCDDNNAQIGPGANEQCNGIDDDCDGLVDEGNVCSSSCSDGIQNGQETGVDCGGPACPPCTQCLDQDGDGYTTCDGDCDDTNSSTHPGANEICGDGMDNDCDGVVDYDFNSDPNNCGGCEVVCPSAPNTSVACASGVCMFICNAGYADCDGNMNNGCETSISSDQNNCGACGNFCPTGTTCQNGQCVTVCPPQGQACDDGDPCTVGDTADGACNCIGLPMNCDDGVPCTLDQCVNGVCQNSIQPNSCYIDGVCYSAGSSNPSNNCLFCDPFQSNTSWSLVPAGTVCALPSCSGSTYFSTSMCDGTGSCVMGSATDCSPYMCDGQGSGCLTMCANDSDCAPGYYCSSGSCMPKKAAGAPCSGGNECLSGICSGGFCQ